MLSKPADFSNLTADEKDVLLRELYELSAKQVEEISRLRELVEQLQGRLGKNSSNSSKPPSSDGYKKTKSLRRPSGKEPGGQKGHEGRTLEKTATPDIVIEHSLPQRCDVCDASLDRANAQVKTGQVFDIPLVKFEVTEHRAYTVQCGCGKRHESMLPTGICEVAQYGPNIRAQAVHLIHGQMLPYARTAELLHEQYGLEISTGTLVQWGEQAGQLVKEEVAAIGQKIQSSSVAHADESGLRVASKLHWLHVAVTQTHTWYGVHAKRGLEAIEEHGILRSYLGTLVHDCWAPYWDLDCVHALCGTHLLRELQYEHEVFAQPWSQAMMDVLQDANKACHQARENNKTALESSQIQAYIQRYQALVQEGQMHNPPKVKPQGQRDRCKQSTAYNLLQRLKDRQEQVLRFMHDLSVPFTNNLAERAVRMPKVKQKVSGCFRTKEGAENFCLIRSYLDTARKQGMGMLQALQAAFLGKPVSLCLG